MSKKTFAIILSLLVAVMPFLGFPERFDTYFYLASGLMLVALIELISIQHFTWPYSRDSHEEHDDLDVYEDPQGGGSTHVSRKEVAADENVVEEYFGEDDETNEQTETTKKV